MGESDGFADFARHVNPALGRFLRVASRDFKFVRAEGCTLHTSDGETFSDWVAGFGTSSFGHNPEFAKRALAEALESFAPCVYVEALNPFAGELARALVEAAGPPFRTCFFANGGSEAVEAALKTAAIATGRSKVLCLTGGYHGTTLGSLGCMGRGLFRDPFASLIAPIYDSVEPEDVAALERRLKQGDVAAFVCEPMQMEAGARILSRDYLETARRLCTDHGSLLVLDEIQTGLGRTGELFAFQSSNVRPDVLVLGKALGAGLVPISAAVFAEGIWERAYDSPLRSEIHNSTLGGNRLSSQVALAVVKELQKPAFLPQVRQRAEQLATGLDQLRHAHRCVRRVSSWGLLGGLELGPVTHPWATWSGLGLPELEPRSSAGALLIQHLAKHHQILAHVCGHDWSVVRIEPPLTVSEQECQRFLQALDQSLAWLEQNAVDA